MNTELGDHKKWGRFQLKKLSTRYFPLTYKILEKDHPMALKEVPSRKVENLA